MVDSRGSLLLHLAAARGHIQVAKFLMFAYAEGFVHKDIDVRHPVHIAAMNGHTDVIQEILQIRSYSTKILIGSDGTILHLCTKFNQYESFKLFVQIVSTGLNVLLTQPTITAYNRERVFERELKTQPTITAYNRESFLEFKCVF